MSIDGNLGLALVSLTDPRNTDHRRQIDLFYGMASLRIFDVVNPLVAENQPTEFFRDELSVRAQDKYKQISKCRSGWSR